MGAILCFHGSIIAQFKSKRDVNGRDNFTLERPLCECKIAQACAPGIPASPLPPSPVAKHRSIKSILDIKIFESVDIGKMAQYAPFFHYQDNKGLSVASWTEYRYRFWKVFFINFSQSGIILLGLKAILFRKEGDVQTMSSQVKRKRYSYYVFQCVGSGNKCYATDQCCKGFVCAAFDDLFGKYWHFLDLKQVDWFSVPTYGPNIHAPQKQGTNKYL